MESQIRTETHPSYPVNLLVDQRCCLVVGGGPIAFRKTSGLLASGAKVTVVAPEICAGFDTLEVVRVQRRYQPSDLAGQWLVIACTNDQAVNSQVSADATASHVWVNSADDLPNCSFTLPAIAWHNDLSIAISTAGKSPAMASWLRQRFEAEFEKGYVELLELLATVRSEAKAELGTTEVPGWIEALDSGLVDLVAEGKVSLAHDRLRQSIGLEVAL